MSSRDSNHVMNTVLLWAAALASLVLILAIVALSQGPRPKIESYEDARNRKHVDYNGKPCTLDEFECKRRWLNIRGAVGR